MNRPGAPAEAYLAVKVQPGASRERIVGLLGDAVKIAVSAPPEKGKANQAVEKLLAREFGLPTGQVEVGAGGRHPAQTRALAGRTTDQAASGSHARRNETFCGADHCFARTQADKRGARDEECGGLDAALALAGTVKRFALRVSTACRTASESSDDGGALQSGVSAYG